MISELPELIFLWRGKEGLDSMKGRSVDSGFFILEIGRDILLGLFLSITLGRSWELSLVFCKYSKTKQCCIHKYERFFLAQSKKNSLVYMLIFDSLFQRSTVYQLRINKFWIMICINWTMWFYQHISLRVYYMHIYYIFSHSMIRASVIKVSISWWWNNRLWTHYVKCANLTILK